MVSRAYPTSNFDRVGIAVETPQMIRQEINDPDDVFERRYYIFKSDVKAFLEGKRDNIPIYKMKEAPEI